MDRLFLITALLVPQVIGMGMLFMLRRRLAAAALVAPLCSSTAHLVVANLHFAEAARQITAARGEPPCGAFGAMVVLIAGGGALIHAITSIAIVGASALAIHLRRRRAQYAA